MGEDERIDRQREAILSQCPYVRSFLDSDGKKINFSRWQTEYSRQSATINEQLEEGFGKSWYNTLIMPQHIWFWQLQILDPAHDEQRQKGTLQMLFKFGYELGGIDNSQLLYSEIVSRVKNENYLNKRLLKTPEGRAVSINAIRAVLKSGAYLKTHPTMQLRSDIPLTIQNALQDLDVSGLGPQS